MKPTPLQIKEARQLRDKCGFSQEDLARLMGASWATDGAIAPEEFIHFLSTPAPLLRGYPPQDLLQSAYSFQDLLAYMDSAKSGDMA